MLFAYANQAVVWSRHTTSYFERAGCEWITDSSLELTGGERHREVCTRVIVNRCAPGRGPVAYMFGIWWRECESNGGAVLVAPSRAAGQFNVKACDMRDAVTAGLLKDSIKVHRCAIRERDGVPEITITVGGSTPFAGKSVASATQRRAGERVGRLRRFACAN